MTFLFPDWPAPSCVRSLSTLRGGGASAAPYHGASPADGGLNLALHVGDDVRAVAQNRALLKERLPSAPLWLNQVHGTQVATDEVADGAPSADACVTRARGRVCVVLTADCLPVLFCDTAGSVVAAAHAGWRGLAGGILEETVSALRRAGAGELLAWLGPAIGPARFEVGEPVARVFAAKDSALQQAFRHTAGDKYLADIYLLARLILAKQGVVRVSACGRCTVSEPDCFYSYRRDGATGRMGSCIWLE
ncbi:MAG: peptidoglycan editing factor PgeF [Burkholderiaceae bacterium]|jgi:YfiH family protein|nr:peptidoglycan editing factor PgeF [Burkholderiaceae bacterium]